MMATGGNDGTAKMNISFSVSDDLPLVLNEAPQDVARDIRFWAALALYRKQRLSLGKAAELAGNTKIAFIERLRLEGEPVFDYDEEALLEIEADASRLP